MTDTLALLQQILTRFDHALAKFVEHDVSSAIKEIERPAASSIPIELKAEQMAFDFCENYQDETSGWGTYYGPLIVWPVDGAIREYPSIQVLTPEILSYWSTRAEEASHPILKTRYADLVWTFAKVVRDVSPTFRMAHIAIDSRLEISKRDLPEYDIATVEHLKRALTLSVSLSDTKRFEQTRHAIIAFEDKISEDDKLGTWGFSYNLLISGNYKKHPLPANLEDKIISTLERRRQRLVSPTVVSLNDSRVFGAKKATNCLSSYYHGRNQSGDLKRVLTSYFIAFQYLLANDEAWLVSSWLQETHEMFTRYGLRKEADQIAIALRNVGAGALSELKSVSVEVKIPTADLEEYAAELIDGELEEALARVSRHFIPRNDEVEKEVEELAKQHPLIYLVQKQTIDHEGRPVASIGSLEEDLRGNVVSHVSQSLTYMAPFLREVMTSAIKKYKLSPQIVVDYLFVSPLFSEDRRGIIEKGIEAYLEGDYVTSTHLLIPQIEATIRKLVDLNGGSILKKSRTGGMQYRVLDELLREEVAENALPKDVVYYFQIMLTDQRGWNLRNIVSHGMMPQQDFGYEVADRTVHILLCLGLSRS